MKNIGVMIIAIVVIAAIIVFGVTFVTLDEGEDVVYSEDDIYTGSDDYTEDDDYTEGETGAFNDMNFVIDDYTISIDSKEKGHPDVGSYFSTDITIEDDEGTESYYNIDFTDIIDSDEKPYDSDFEVYEYGTILINGKKYKYYINNDGWNAVLCYLIPNEKKDLIIKINGSDVFDAEGNQAKHMAIIDEDVLNSEELAGVLNYSVAK